MNDQNELINASLEALKRNPNDKEAFGRVVDYLVANSDARRLVSIYEKYPQFADWSELIKLLVQIAEKEPDAEKKSGIYHVCGQVCEMKLQSPNDALNFFKVAIKTWSGRVQSVTASRNIYMNMGNYKMVFQLIALELRMTTSKRHQGELLMEASRLMRQAKQDKQADEYEAKAKQMFALADQEGETEKAKESQEVKKVDAEAEKKAEEEAKAAEEAKKAEEEAKAAEEARKAEEEAKAAEEARKAEEAKKAEEEAKAAEEARKAEEAKKAEEEAKAAEGAAKAEEAKAAEEAKKAEEEAKAAEEAAKAEEAKSAEEEVKAAEEEAKAAEEEAKAAEEEAKDEENEAKAEENEAKAEEAKKAEEVTQVTETAHEADAKHKEIAIDAASITEFSELIYKLADNNDADGIEAAAAKACELISDMEEAEPLCDALEEVGSYSTLASTLAALSDKLDDGSAKRILLADRADVLDLRLDRRDEAVDIATPIAEGSDRASYQARAVLAGKDRAQLEALTASMTDLLKKLRKTPEEIPFMSVLAHIYSDRLGSMKDAEEQFKRIKLADPKNYKMLRFYCRYYEESGDWQRVLSSLQTLKGAVAGSYRELSVSRQIARISEERLNNPNKAVNVWNQMLKEGLFVDVAREELIGLYQRTQKWQQLLEIYKNDEEAIDPENKAARIDVIKKSIAIYDEHLKNDAMVIKNYHKILDIDPTNDEAVDALITRYEASKRWNDLLKILNQKADHTTDKDASVEIYYRIANLWSTSLGNVAKSIEPLNKVIEIDPTQKKALQQLHEFYEQRNNWANLYDIVSKEADVADNAEKVSLLKRQAEIAEHNLHSADKAIESWETLSRNLEDPSEALEELARLYKKQDDNEKLLTVYERAIEHSHSESERIANMERVADLYIEKLNARDKGIETLHAILEREDGRDRALEQLTEIHRDAEEWDELSKLYLDLDEAPQLYELLDLTASDVDDESVQIELYERMARIAQDNLHDDDMAVSAYEKILEVDPTNEKTAKQLLSFYTARGDHSKAIDAIQIIIAWTSDLDEKIAMHVQIAGLYENEIGDVDSAANWYAKAVELAPNRSDLREHYEHLIEQTGHYDELYQVYAPLVRKDALDDGARNAIHRVLARICQKHLDKPEAAITSWEACLAADNDDREAIDSLGDLYEQTGSWEKLLSILDRKLALTEDGDEIKSLSFKRAGLLVSQLENLEEAEKSYRRVLELDESNLDAMHGLKAIYDTTENWEKLVEILKKEQELGADDRLESMFNLAEIDRNHLNKTDEAIQLYAAILDEDPSHERTISTLESLVRDGVEPSRLAEILEPVYRNSGNHAKECEALEIRLKSLDNADKIPVLWQIYDLRHDTLNDKLAAFNVAVRLFTLNPEDERVWDNLNDLAEESGEESKWQQIDALYADIPVDDEFNDDWRYELLRRRAIILEEKLGRDVDSIELWEQLHAHDSEKSEFIQHLEKLYKNNNSFDKLVKLLEFETTLSDLADDDRVRIHLEAAQIYEDILEKPEDAIRVYRAVLEIESDNRDALQALERLYASNGMWRDLAGLYERELDAASDAAERKGILTKLADTYNTHLGDYGKAVENYREILDSEHDSDVIAAADALLKKLVSAEGEENAEHRAALCELLEPIYTGDDATAELVALLRIKLQDCDDDYERVELNRRIADLLKDRLNDNQGAFEALKSALQINISEDAIRSDFEDLALKLENPKAIIDLYESRLDAVDDDVLKRTLYQRMAGIYEHELNDSEHAIAAYRSMLELDDLDKESLDALERLYMDAQNWTELLDILKHKAEIGDGDEKVGILRKMATINNDCLDNTKAAIECYREILDNVSDDRDAIDALETLYASTEDWENLSENYGIKLQLTSDNEEKRGLLKKMANLQEEKLKQYDEAVQLYTQVLDLFPEDEETLDSLDRLYLNQENYDDLTEILRKKLDLSRDSETSDNIEYRLGQIYQNKLNSVEQALEFYKSILDRKPDHAQAHEALRGLLDNEDYQIEASRILETVYERTDQNEKLAEMLEIQLANESDPYTQVELLKRIASIHQDKLSNYAETFKDMARIVKISQEPEYIEQIENLTEVLDNTPELVEVYKDVVGNAYDPDLQVSFNNKIADMLQNRLDDEAQAETFYKAALEVQNDEPHALDALDAIYTKRESWKDLLEILSQKLDASPEAEKQLPLLYRVGDIQERLCSQHDDAIETYQRILQLDASEQKAKDALSTIYEQQEMWTELSDLLRSEITDATDSSVVAALKFKLAKLQNEKLNDDYEAVTTLQEIIADNAEDENARGYLEELFEKGVNPTSIAEILEPIYKSHNDWNKLIHSLEVRAGIEEDEFSKAQILNDIASTYLNNLEDPSKALETYGRILMLQPTETGVQEKIEALAAQTGELQVWADLYTKVVDDNLIDDYQDKRVIMISLARLSAERLGDHDKARALCAAMLEEDPEEMEAYDILEWSYAQKRDYDALLKLWIKKAEILQDQDEKIGLMLRIATVQEEIAHDEGAACATYQEILEIDQNAAGAAPALERLLRKTGNYEELANFYRQQSDYAANDDARVDNLQKFGVILFRELHNTEEAVSVLGDALATKPSSNACKRTLEEMLNTIEPTDDNAEIRNNIATMLEPLYADNEWSKLARVIGVMIHASDDNDAKVDLYMREAALYEAHDSHAKRAFETYAKAFVLAPGNNDAREKLEALSAEFENDTQLAEVYTKAIESSEDDVEKTSLYERLAGIYRDSLKDNEKAAAAYEAILGMDEFNLPAITALEDLYARTQKHDKRVEVLRKHAELSSNLIDQKDLFYRIADIQESILNQNDEAVKTYQNILDLDAEDQLALDALEKLYEKAENWNDLIEIYKRKIDVVTTFSDRVELYVKAARTYREKLNDTDNAIENYVQALNEDRSNLDILTALEELYTETKNNAELLEILQAKIDCARQAGDTQFKHLNELKMARILIADGDENARAIEVLNSVLSEDANNAEAIGMLNGLLENAELVNDVAAILMPLYKNAGNFRDYLRVCERQIEISDDDFEKRTLYMDAAAIATSELGDANKAFEFLKPAMLANPADDEIAGLAENVALQHNAYENLTSLCEDVIENANDPDASVKLSLLAAKYYEQYLGNIEKTIAQYERIVDIDAMHLEALDNLHRLYKQTGQTDKLAGNLQQLIDAGATPINGIRYELAALKLQNEPAEALELLKQILWEEPENEDAIRALEVLLPNKELTMDIAEFLEPHYNKTGDNEKLANLLRAKVELTDDPSDALMLLKQIAKLELDELHDDRAAFDTYVKALEKDASDTEVLAAIESIAGRIELWNELAAAYDKAIESASGDTEKIDMYLKQAALFDGKLDRMDDAKNALNHILEMDADNLDALHHLEKIYARTQENEKLLEVRAHLADLTYEAPEQKRLLYQCADIALNILNLNDKGIVYLEKIVEIDDTESNAIEPLLVLYQEAQDYEKYAELLNKKLLNITDPLERFDAYVSLAKVSDEKLQDPAAAIDAYRNALSINHSAETYAALEALLIGHEQYQELDDLYIDQLDNTVDGPKRSAIKVKRAKIAEEQFHDDDQAISLLKEALSDDPSNAAAFNGLDAIYSKNDNYDELYQLLLEQKAAATSDDVILTFNIRIAKLAATHLGDPDKAIDSLTEVLNAQPNNLEAIDSLIDIYKQQKAYDLAFNMMQRKLDVLDSNVEKANVKCELARLLKSAKWDVAQIETAYCDALAYDSRNEDALSALLELAKESGNTARQLELLNLKADNQSELSDKLDILNNIAEIASADPAFAKEAADALAKIYEAKPDDTELGEKVVNAYIKANMPEKAQPVLDGIIDSLSAAKQTKRLPPFYSLKGKMLKLSGDIAGARAAFESAAAIDKTNVANNLELGILLYEAGDYDASLKIMQTLLLHQMNVKDKEVKTNIFYYLGMLRVKTNDAKRAKDMFNRALGVDPNHAPTKEALAALG